MNARCQRSLARNAPLLLVALVGLPALFVVAADTPSGKPASPEGYTDTPMLPGGKWHVHDPNRPLPPVVTPGKSFSQMADAPSDALVLFDGKDLSKWLGEKGGEPEWKVEGGIAEATKGRIHTKDE